ERAAVGEHLREPQIVDRRPGRAGAAAVELGRLAGMQYALRPVGQWIVGEGQRVAALLGVRNREAGVDHADRRPQALLKGSTERLAGDGLDDKAEHVCGKAVIPNRPRLIKQWYLGDGCNELGSRVAGRRGRRSGRPQLVHLCLATATIGETRRM